MRRKEAHFNAQELFDSLPPQEQERINCAIRDNASRREQERYLRLEKAEIERQKVVQKLDAIEYEIAENDDWFVSAKERKVNVTIEELNLHRRKAEELYSRKKSITDRLLQEAASNIEAIVSHIEAEEQQESLFQRRDLRRLLEPIYEERDRERRKIQVAQIKEREKQREEEEALRQKEYEALLARLRAEEWERRRNLEAERRKKRAEEIIARVHARKVPYLVHFTPIANLESILRDGLRSRNALAGHDFVFTDEYRTDGWVDWISVSISFPNYKMLYAKKNSLKNVEGWAIILIRKEALWELDCKFILTNAASSGIRMFQEEKWSSAQAFEDMFNHAEHRIGIPDFYATDPQAEVMIRDEIPRSYIGMIAVENKRDETRLDRLIDVRVIPQLFRWRSDFEHWCQFRLSAFSSERHLVAPF